MRASARALPGHAGRAPARNLGAARSHCAHRFAPPLQRRQHTPQHRSGLPVEDHAGKIKDDLHADGSRKRFNKPAVEPSSPAISPLAKRGSNSPASALPSSTPHWSKELMPHNAPLVKTRCSYIATSAPSDRGVSACRFVHRVWSFFSPRSNEKRSTTEFFSTAYFQGCKNSKIFCIRRPFFLSIF